MLTTVMIFIRTVASAIPHSYKTVYQTYKQELPAQPVRNVLWTAWQSPRVCVEVIIDRVKKTNQDR